MIPVYAMGNQRPGAVVATKINTELLPAARELLRLLIRPASSGRPTG